jgi:hypothetical protein
MQAFCNEFFLGCLLCILVMLLICPSLFTCGVVFLVVELYYYVIQDWNSTAIVSVNVPLSHGVKLVDNV